MSDAERLNISVRLIDQAMQMLALQFDYITANRKLLIGGSMKVNNPTMPTDVRWAIFAGEHRPAASSAVCLLAPEVVNEIAIAMGKSRW